MEQISSWETNTALLNITLPYVKPVTSLPPLQECHYHEPEQSVYSVRNCLFEIYFNIILQFTQLPDLIRV